MAPQPTGMSKTKAALIALGGASVLALLWASSGESPVTTPLPPAPAPVAPEKPYNPDAGKYMPLVLYADGKQNPYAVQTGSETRSEQRAREACLQSAYANACRRIAILTTEEPGCIAYARDTKDNTKYHLNIFNRVEDNKRFSGGNPDTTRYFCNNRILEREIQEGLPVSGPSTTIDRTEVYPNEILVLTRDVYLANELGQYRGGPLILEGSCVEFHPNEAAQKGDIAGVAHLVTAWEKNGNGNNRSGYVEQQFTRKAIVGEYTPSTCFAIFGPTP